MRASEKDHLAAEVAVRRVDFEMALSDKRKYPVQQFREFWEIGRRYAELTKRDPTIHRSVASCCERTDGFRNRRTQASASTDRSGCSATRIFGL
jgi:hypothetical protein